MTISIINIDKLRFFEIIYYHWGKIINSLMGELWDEIKLFGGSAARGLVWTLWNFVFGLVPLYVLCKCEFLGSSDWNFLTIISSPNVTNNIIQEGAILFICTALMGEVAIDYLLSDFRSKLLGLSMVAVTAFLFLYNESVFEWFALHGETIKKTGLPEQVKHSVITQFWWMLFTIIYCIAVKSRLIYFEKSAEQ